MRGKSGKATKVREQFSGAETQAAAAPEISVPEVPVEETPKD
jgi:hypothetical protein